MYNSNKMAYFYAVLAAALYAISSPVSKLLLKDVPSVMLAGLLYLGAGVGVMVVRSVRGKIKSSVKEVSLTRDDLPYVIGMVLLDIVAPILLLVGLTTTSAANVSLLNNFEIVATSLIAMMLFKERISIRLWVSIGLVTLASIMLSIQDVAGTFSFSRGSLLVIGACVCWGFENNCTRKISGKDPMEIVEIKGLCSGTGSLLIGLWTGERLGSFIYILAAMVLGFVAYGLSISFYIRAQRSLGAAKTSTYYAISPFIGVILSFLLFREIPGVMFFLSLLIMIAGTYLARE